MRGLCRGAIGVALALAFVLGTSSGSWAAEGDAEADRLISAGVSLRQNGKDEEALAQFSRAYDVSHGAHARAQMGLAEQALGRWDLAEAHLVEALSATTDPWIKRHRSDLEAAVADVRAHLGTLEILGGVPGAEVRVNGTSTTHLPLAAPLRVPAGTVVVEIVAPGYVPVERTVIVPAGGLARETFVLVKEAVAEPPPQPQAPEAPAGPPAAVVTSTPPSEPSPGADWRKPAAWGAAGGAAVALGVGVGFTVRMYSNEHSFNQSCALDERNYGGGSCPTYHDNATSSQAIAITGYVVGAALAGASAYLFWRLTEQPHATTTSQAALRCAPDVASRGISCGTSFF